MIDILIVDDNKSLVDSLVLLLDDFMGIKVSIAYDGKDAMEMVKKRRYDIYFIDIYMGGKNGYEIGEYIHRKYRDKVAMIAITGAEYEGFEYDIYITGFVNVLKKPFTNKEFLDVLDHYISRVKGVN